MAGKRGRSDKPRREKKKPKKKKKWDIQVLMKHTKQSVVI